ncbi:MAG: tetratricopeptide repeat protein, partial [bacterium]
PGLNLKAFPPIRSLSAQLHNLPVQATEFVGRERELGEITRHLANSHCRMLTLVGPGGMGKTRLALQAAAESIEAFRHGVWFVDLAPVGSARSIPAAIARAVRRVPRKGEGTVDHVTNYFREKTLLLVVDNFEHLMNGADLMSTLLREAPGLKLLVTSRERLNLQEEWAFDVGGLDAGEAGTLGADGGAALRLFTQAARRARSAFVLSADNASDVRRVCELVEGMPLGIELAAVWTRTLSPREIAEELVRERGLDATPLRNVAARHRSLRAVFEYSWNLLDEEKRRVLRAVSVFNGGFTREAAERVAGADLALLTALLDKSLLRRGHGGRFGLHALMREYLIEKLREIPGEEERAQREHAGYFSGLLEMRLGGLQGGKQAETIGEILADLDNVQPAWSWIVGRGKTNLALAAYECLFEFYNMRGASAQMGGEFGQMIDSLEGGSEKWEGTPRERTILLAGLIARRVIAMGSEHGGRVQMDLSRSIEMLKSVGAEHELVFPLRELGRLHEDALVASELAHQSLNLSERLGFTWGKADGLMTMGEIAERAGTFDEAELWYAKSLRVFNGLGDHFVSMYLHCQMARLAVRRGAYEDARARFREFLPLYESFSRRLDYAGIWDIYWFAEIALEIRLFDAAERLCREMLALAEDLGERLAYALALQLLGKITVAMGKYAEGQKHAQGALERLRALADAHGIGLALETLGVCAWRMGNHAEARRMIGEALAVYGPMGDPHDPARCHDLLARMDADQGGA